MRWLGLSFLLIASAGLVGCGKSLGQQEPPTKWTTGFWFWNGSEASVIAPVNAIDLIFCQVGVIVKKTWPLRSGEPWSVYGTLPEHLPPAREYWLVFRSDSPGIPAREVVPKLAEIYSKLRNEGQRRGLQVAGIQLDIDSPTRALPNYAAFLSEFRKELPTSARISITGLLDWFRDGTAISAVLREVDEFVPQFYDVQDANRNRGGGIAARFDADKWGPIFNAYRKVFRIGISTFGRSRLVRSDGEVRGIIGDIKPLDIAVDSAFQLHSSRTEANELVLSYRATRRASVGYADFDLGDEIQFALSTPETIRSEVEGARRIHGFCAGVVFFRWPAFNEALAAQPTEVLNAAGADVRPENKLSELRTTDGNCATVNCVDLYFIDAQPLSSEATRYGIHSSRELEYFLPAERMPVHMTGPSRMELRLPPYCGRSRMYLGRAVTSKPAEFTLEQER